MNGQEGEWMKWMQTGICKEHRWSGGDPGVQWGGGDFHGECSGHFMCNLCQDVRYYMCLTRALAHIHHLLLVAFSRVLGDI